jgi:hypothetical protein
MLYYYHWTSGHKQGFAPIALTLAEIESIFEARRKDDPAVTFEVTEAK